VPIGRLNDFLGEKLNIENPSVLNRGRTNKVIPTDHQVKRICALYSQDYAIEPNY